MNGILPVAPIAMFFSSAFFFFFLHLVLLILFVFLPVIFPLLIASFIDEWAHVYVCVCMRACACVCVYVRLCNDMAVVQVPWDSVQKRLLTSDALTSAASLAGLRTFWYKT